MNKKKWNSPQKIASLLEWWVPRVIGATHGLFAETTADPRWNEFFITAIVLKKYRKQSSFIFVIVHGLKGIQKHTIVAGEAKALLARLVGAKERDLLHLSGIYRGLLKERGAAIATAAIIEIVRISNMKRSGKKSFFSKETLVPKIFHKKNKQAPKKKTKRI